MSDAWERHAEDLKAMIVFALLFDKPVTEVWDRLVIGDTLVDKRDLQKIFIVERVISSAYIDLQWRSTVRRNRSGDKLLSKKFAARNFIVASRRLLP